MLENEMIEGLNDDVAIGFTLGSELGMEDRK
jgi:hypothetical protein